MKRLHRQLAARPAGPPAVEVGRSGQVRPKPPETTLQCSTCGMKGGHDQRCPHWPAEPPNEEHGELGGRLSGDLLLIGLAAVALVGLAVALGRSGSG